MNATEVMQAAFAIDHSQSSQHLNEIVPLLRARFSNNAFKSLVRKGDGLLSHDILTETESFVSNRSDLLGPELPVVETIELDPTGCEPPADATTARKALLFGAATVEAVKKHLWPLVANGAITSSA